MNNLRETLEETLKCEKVFLDSETENLTISKSKILRIKITKDSSYFYTIMKN